MKKHRSETEKAFFRFEQRHLRFRNCAIWMDSEILKLSKPKIAETYGITRARVYEIVRKINGRIRFNRCKKSFYEGAKGK